VSSDPVIAVKACDRFRYPYFTQMGELSRKST
jgi:hypothetical protein